MELGAERILVRLVVTSPVDLPRIRETERNLKHDTGRDVTLSVRRVAAEEELALLRERLRTPAPRPLQDMEGIRAELLARLEKPLEESWPSNAAPVLDYELPFTPTGLLVRVGHLAEQPLDPVLEETLSNVLRARLGVGQLRLALVHEAPPPPP